MAFAFIRAASRPLLTVGEAGEPAASAGPAAADRAAAAPRADYERWSRWALGVVGFVAAAGGMFFAGTRAHVLVTRAAAIAAVLFAGMTPERGVRVGDVMWGAQWNAAPDQRSRRHDHGRRHRRALATFFGRGLAMTEIAGFSCHRKAIA